MRSSLRSLTFGLAGLLSAGAMAQYPYTIALSGTVANCYPGQMVTVQTVQGTMPQQSFTVTLDSNTCSYSVFVSVSNQPAWLEVTTLCGGMMQVGSDSSQFDFVGDTATSFIDLICGGGAYDCLQILNGPNLPGTPCDDGNPSTWGDLWTPACVCTGVDSTNTTDCMGVPGGQSIPGTFCINFFGDSGIWSMDCICETNSNPQDCLGNPGGGALPGTACLYTEDNGNTWISGIWSLDCICGPDSIGSVDCLGVPGGSALPGTPCAAFGMVGTWDSNCDCVPSNPDPCEADFWVIQAMGPDSLPIPYELWVWNLSSGNVVYSWDFGDGTTSTEAFPTHTYSGNGPYNLCLTVADNNGCTDTYCDSISINADGVYEGMVVHAGDRQDGFTINVQDPQSTGVQEEIAGGNIATWPNPVVDELNVAVVSEMQGLVTVTITDLDGRTVKTERTSLGGGRSQLRIATSGLNAGMYLLRISNGSSNLSQRFVKTN